MYLESLGEISEVKYVINCDTAILVFPSSTEQSMKCSIQNLNKSIKRIWNDLYRPVVWSRMQEVLAKPFISMAVMENHKTPAAERKSVTPGNGKTPVKRQCAECIHMTIPWECLVRPPLVSCAVPAEMSSRLVTYKAFFFFLIPSVLCQKKFKESFLEMPRRIEYNISLNFNGTSKCLGFPPLLIWKSQYIVGKQAFMVVLLLSHHEKCIKVSSTKLVFIFSKVEIQH